MTKKTRRGSGNKKPHHAQPLEKKKKNKVDNGTHVTHSRGMRLGRRRKNRQTNEGVDGEDARDGGNHGAGGGRARMSIDIPKCHIYLVKHKPTRGGGRKQ